MLNIAEVKGKFIIMIDSLLSEFNPEIAEEARKGIDIPVTEMTEDEWYNIANLRQYLFKVTEGAQRVLGKKMVYAAGEAFDELVEMFEKPCDLIKFTVENNQGNFRKENLFKPQILDSGDDFITLKLDTDGIPTFYEGAYLGLLEKYRIIKTNVTTTIEEESDEQQLCIMNIKWQ